MNREQRRQMERDAKLAALQAQAEAERKAAFARRMANAKLVKAAVARGVKLIAPPDPKTIAMAQAAVKRAQERQRRIQNQTVVQ